MGDGDDGDVKIQNVNEIKSKSSLSNDLSLHLQQGMILGKFIQQIVGRWYCPCILAKT